MNLKTCLCLCVEVRRPFLVTKVAAAMREIHVLNTELKKERGALNALKRTGKKF